MSPNPALLTWPRPVAVGGGSLVAEFTDAKTDAANATTYTFTGVNIGPAAADRTVVVGFGLRTAGSSVVNSVTIGGETAAIDVQSFNSGSRFAFARAVVPTGTTATVVVTLAAGAVRAGIGVWRITGGPIAVADTDDYGVVGSSGSLSVSIPSGGVCLAGLAGSATTSVAWTGLASVDFDTQMGAEAGWLSGGRSSTGAITFNTTSGTPQAIAIAYEPS